MFININIAIFAITITQTKSPITKNRNGKNDGSDQQNKKAPKQIILKILLLLLVISPISLDQYGNQRATKTLLQLLINPEVHSNNHQNNHKHIPQDLIDNLELTNNTISNSKDKILSNSSDSEYLTDSTYEDIESKDYDINITLLEIMNNKDEAKRHKLFVKIGEELEKISEENKTLDEFYNECQKIFNYKSLVNENLKGKKQHDRTTLEIIKGVNLIPTMQRYTLQNKNNCALVATFYYILGIVINDISINESNSLFLDKDGNLITKGLF